MFTHKENFGNHSVYSYDTKNFDFKSFLTKLYQCNELDMLHLTSTDYNYYLDRLELGILNDRETDLHKMFYKEIKSNDTFKKIYCSLISSLCKDFFDNEEGIIFQSFPSIRFQFPLSIAVPPHKDSDSLGNHPLGERNFLIPITRMFNTNTIYVESEPDKKDYKGMELNYGELFYFNGNTCTHYNQVNKENKLRISFDFRIITFSDYKKYINDCKIVSTNPRDSEKIRTPVKMLIGQYYQIYYRNSFTSIEEWFKITEKILQHVPLFGEEERNAVNEYMSLGGFITEYNKTLEFEKVLSEYIKVKHCICTTSGTMALILSLLAVNIQKEDYVIVPNYTMVATINVIKLIGAIPIIVDVDQSTYTINLTDIKNAYTNKVKCVIHVSLNNKSCNLFEIRDWCKENNVFLIEDAAQSLGSFIDNVHLGTVGDLGCFSLSTPKIISTGQGGFIVTNNDELNDKLRRLKNFGREKGSNDNYVDFGINGKFTDIQAVIGLEQMKKLPERIIHKKLIYNTYKDCLNDISVKIIQKEDENWIPWFVEIIVSNREQLISFLSKHNIETRITYPPLEKNDKFVNTNSISENGLFLPSSSNLKVSDVRYICSILKLFYTK